jgi:hypothetical protein
MNRKLTPYFIYYLNTFQESCIWLTLKVDGLTLNYATHKNTNEINIAIYISAHRKNHWNNNYNLVQYYTLSHTHVSFSTDVTSPQIFISNRIHILEYVLKASSYTMCASHQ